MSSLPVEFFDTLQALGITETWEILWISVPEQRLRLFVNRLPITEFSVSTAKNGVGCHRNSFQTPIGLHRIAQKIGEGEPVRTIFRERAAIGVFPSRVGGGGSRASSNHESR